MELLRIDPWNEIGDIIYYGYSSAGSSESHEKWCIKRKVLKNGVYIYEYPYINNNIALHSLTWERRTGYTYLDNNGNIDSGTTTTTTTLAPTTTTTTLAPGSASLVSASITVPAILPVVPANAT